MHGRLALPLVRVLAASLVVVGLSAPFVLELGSPPRPTTPAVALSSPRSSLAFEPDAGRYGHGLRFIARRGNYALGLMRDGSTVLSSHGARVVTRLVDARRDAAIVPESRLAGTVNSYVGRDKSRWRTGLPTFGAVRYRDVYPGIDLRYHGSQGRLEYDYVLRPGADPTRIAMSMTGAGTPKLTPDGDLVMRTRGGSLRQHRPVAYQQIGGHRVPVEARFRVAGTRVSFSLGDYDMGRPLVIDPQLVFTTYIGGTGIDNAKRALVVKSNGTTYLLVAGSTRSASFHGSNQNTDPGLASSDAFISKLSADGSTVLSTTFFGGTASDDVSGIVIGNGALFVTGSTSSDDLPTTASLVTPYDDTYTTGDSWIGRFDLTDLSLAVVTYFAGSSGAGIAYSNFTVAVAGTEKTAGLATAGAYDTTLANEDAYAATFNASLTQLKWASYLGSSADDIATALTANSSGAVFVTGYTVAATDFPVTVGSGTAQGLDGFLSELSADGTSLTFSRLYGGSGFDISLDVWIPVYSPIAVIAGQTDSPSLPGVSGGAPPASLNGFFAQFSTDSSTTFGGAFIGGSGSNDYVTSLALDPYGGNVHVAGVTNSTDMPTTNPVQSQNAGGNDAFVAEYHPGLGTWTPVYQTYLGGTGSETTNDLALDPQNAEIAYLVGETTSQNLGATATYSENAGTPVQAQNAGSLDGFVARLQPLSAKITSGPAEGSTVASATANFTLGPTTESGGTFECKLDNGSFTSCTSTPSYPGLADGSHTFSAQYFPPSSGTDGSVAVRHWTVDATPPATFSPGSPSDNAIVAAAPTFTWSPTTDALSEPVTYELWIDGAKRSEQAVQKNGVYSLTLEDPLSDGAHTWEAHAIDAVGNVRPTATRALTVDATGPTVPGLGSPAEAAELSTPKPTLSWSAASDGGIGLAEYDIELDGRVLGLHLSPSTLSYTPPTALVEGPHDWRAIATDQFGNSSRSTVGHFRVDVTPPNAQLTVSPNPVLAGRSVTLDAASSNDPAGGRITRYEWDLDGDGKYESDGATTPTIQKTFSASGSYLLGVRVTDPVGQSREAQATLIVTTPPVPPGLLGVTINNGAQFTKTPDVTLFLKFPSLTSQLLASNDGGFLGPTVFKPQQQVAWKLDSSGPERLPKTVYVRFLLSGIVSETYTDDIILDEVPPVVVQAFVIGDDSDEPAQAAAVRTYRVKLKATDSNSGVNAVQITAKKSKPGKFLKYKTTLKVKAATRKLYVRARDRAGNLSKWKKTR